MNFEPPASPRPRPRPPQPQPPAAEGVDAASLVAARTAAVARNRQKAARTALIHDLLRILGVVVLIGGVALIVHVKHQHRLEEERQQAVREAAAQAARAKEREAAAARAEARRAVERAEAAEKRRQEEEKKQALERKAEAKRQVEANRKRHQTALERFRGTVLELLSAAPAADLPARVVGETWYSCVTPAGRSGLTLYEIQALPGKDIHVTRLDEKGEVADVPLGEFNRLVSGSSYLLAKGTHCYYKGTKNWQMRVSVPAAGEKLDPSHEDFRDLYAFAARQCDKRSALSYEVFFRDVGGAETRILVLPFGTPFERADVVKGLQQSSARRIGAAALEARMNEGSLVVRRKGGAR